MDDTCRITRTGADTGPIDDETGDVIAPGSSTVYDSTTTGFEGRELGGRCMVRTGNLTASSVGEVGNEDIATLDHQVTIPWDAPQIRIGDVVEVLTSRRDPQLVGNRFAVDRIKVGTMIVSRRLDTHKIVPIRRVG